MILYGASGHGKVIADILRKSGETHISFFDDAPNANISGYEVNPVQSPENTSEPVIISIGNNQVRSSIAQKKYNWGIAIHPSVIIGENAQIAQGTVVMAGVIINPSVEIGEHCIINTSSSIDHDCKIANFVHISPNATLAGNVQVGEGTWIGAGSVIIQGIKIGKWATIGAGSVIIKDVPDFATVVGNPGRIIQEVKS